MPVQQLGARALAEIITNRRAARRDPKSVHAACRTRAPATSMQAPALAAWQPSSHICAIVRQSGSKVHRNEVSAA